MEKHSGEIKVILGKPPSWLLRNGTMLAIAAFFLLLGVMFIITYPEEVDGRLRLTTKEVPVSVIAPSSGYVELFKSEGENVAEGEGIGIIQNAADYEDMSALEIEVIDLMEFQKEDYLGYKSNETWSLGEVQDAYNAFNKTISEFVLVENDRTDEAIVSQIRNQKRNFKKSIEFIDDEIKQLEAELAILEDSETKKKEQDKLRQAGYTVQQYNDYLAKIKQLKREIIQKKANRNKLLGDIDNSNLDILIEQTEVSEGSLSKYQEIKDKLNVLYSAIQKWKNKYYLKAPINGQITLYDAQTIQQFIKKDEEVLAVVPEYTNDDIVGRIKLPLVGSGKVEEGQRVLIKFDTYPFLEYGFTEGTIISKSLLPTPGAEEYSLMVELPKGLVTSRGKEIKFRQNMLADAEIITEDARLYERVFGAVTNTWKRLFG